MILRLFRWLGGVLGMLFGAAALYVGVALMLGAVPVNADFHPAPDGIAVAVCSNGVHTDFVLPVKTAALDWSAQFPAGDFMAPVAVFDHIGIGWGDFDFYRSTPTWRDFDLGVALRALAGRGPSALHVQFRPGPSTSENCRSLRLDAAHYRALSDTIIAARAPGSAVFGYGGSDAFYPAQGHFSLFRTCNAWIGARLKAAGLPAGLWTPFAFQVLAPLQRAAGG